MGMGGIKENSQSRRSFPRRPPQARSQSARGLAQSKTWWPSQQGESKSGCELFHTKTWDRVFHPIDEKPFRPARVEVSLFTGIKPLTQSDDDLWRSRQGFSVWPKSRTGHRLDQVAKPRWNWRWRDHDIPQPWLPAKCEKPPAIQTECQADEKSRNNCHYSFW